MARRAAAGVSVVIPAYRSAATLPALVRRIAGTMQAADRPWEIVVVDDGSPDETGRVLDELARAWPKRLTAVRLARNYGQHAALLGGVRLARFPLVVTLDDDLQHPPEEIPALLAALRPGVDLVYGVPIAEQRSRIRVALGRVVKHFIRFWTGEPRVLSISAFRAFRTRLRRAFGTSRGRVNLDVLLSRCTDRYIAVETRHEQRAQGRSTYGLASLAGHALTLLDGLARRPPLLPAFAAATAVAAAVIVLLAPSTPGLGGLRVALLLLAGGQCLTAAALAVQAKRQRDGQRPAYVIRSVRRAQRDGKELARCR